MIQFTIRNTWIKTMEFPWVKDFHPFLETIQ
jgi:hypothetical protein